MKFASVFAIALIAFMPTLPVWADVAADLQTQIDSHNAQLEQLNKEIETYQKQLEMTSAKKQTLQTSLSQIQTSIKKTSTSIKVTENKISTTGLQIQQLSGTISATQRSIDTEHAGLAQSLRRLDSIENQPLAIVLLNEGGITGAWNDVVTLSRLQTAVNTHLESLVSQKETLSNTKTAAEQKRIQLETQQKTLKTQQVSLGVQQKAQKDLLTQTKSQESAYQALIAKKKQQEADLEAALMDLKAKYNVAVNTSDITPAESGILSWPLDNVRITQYFGNTAFARSGAYNGKGHNGMDFAAQIGTPIRAALSGVVIGTGNTDTVRGCYSFGKWVMVKHGNGLNTMYAHFSQISVYEGQQISTGDVLGYSGETGFATGPHLHFGVYVSSATQIIALGQATNQKTPCAKAVMPVAPLAAYLNPLNYLPAR